MRAYKSDLLTELDLNRDGVILTADLAQLGLSPGQIERLLAESSCLRLRKGAYALPRERSPEELHILTSRAVALTHGTGIVFSHTTAALLWQYPLMLPEPGPVNVTVQGGLTKTRNDANLRTNCHMLSGRDTTTRDGLTVTSPTRTVIDCARSLPLKAAVSIADAAAHAGDIDDDDLTRLLSEMKGWKGIGHARRVLALLDPACESPGETWTRIIVTGLGFFVTSQYVVLDGDTFVARADFKIKGHRVLLEFDGSGKYEINGDPAAAHWREKQRNDALEAAGYVVVHLTWDLLRDQQQVKRAITRAIARARRS